MRGRKRREEREGGGEDSVSCNSNNYDKHISPGGHLRDLQALDGEEMLNAAEARKGDVKDGELQHGLEWELGDSSSQA